MLITALPRPECGIRLSSRSLVSVMRKLVGLAVLTICAAFALSYFVHAQGSKGALVVSSCNSQNWAPGSIRQLTMDLSGKVCQ